jgi:hypothetical protein
MISLILNTRKRVVLLNNLLRSIQETASYPEDIQVIINYDADDDETDLFTRSLLDTKFDIQWVTGDRPNNLHKSLNIMANFAYDSSTKYIFVLNDDVEFLTKGWDDQIRKIPSDEIWYISTNDNSADKENTAQYASFPILTRAAYEALGYFMSEKFVGLGADVHLWRIFDSVNRIKETEIELDHVCHRTVLHVHNPDTVAAEMRNNSWSNYVDCWNVEISEDVERVRACL